MKRLAALFAYCLISALATAQEAQALPPGVYLLPPHFYPGDLVELHISLPGAGPSSYGEIPPPAPESDYEIVKVVHESSGKQASLVLFFIPWKSGSIDFLPYMLKGLSSPGLRLHVKSLLSDSEPRLQGMRGFIFLRGTKSFVAFLISGISALILLAWAFLSFFYPLLQRRIKLQLSRRPYRRYLHQTRILRKRLNAGDEAYFYALLSAAFRSWASARLFQDFSSLTAGELAQGGLSGSRFSQALGEDSACVAAILKRADMVRFADLASSRHEREEDLGSLTRVVDGMEANRA